MNNGDVEAAWEYHQGTKHSPWSVRSNPHFLDWPNRPLPFKVYPKIEPRPLPQEVPQTGVAALSAISGRVRSSRADRVPDLRLWRASSSSQQGSPKSANILVDMSIFGRRPAPEPSMRSSCIS